MRCCIIFVIHMGFHGLLSCIRANPKICEPRDLPQIREIRDL